MIARKSLVIIGLGALTVLASAPSAPAQTPATQLVGKWTFSDLQVPPNDAQAAAQAPMAKKQLTGATLQFGADKGFSLNAGGRQVIVGTWVLTGRQIVITPTSFNGTPIAQIKASIAKMAAQNPQMATQMAHITDPLKAAISDNGKTVTLHASSGRVGSATFTRS